MKSNTELNIYLNYGYDLDSGTVLEFEAVLKRKDERVRYGRSDVVNLTVSYCPEGQLIQE